MTIDNLVKELENIGVENAQSEAFIILEELFGISLSSIFCQRDRDYEDEKIEEFLEKRKSGVPLQYIIGKWQFMGLDFLLSKDCLIPRADTEILVYEAIKRAKNAHRVADFCTGSGCIGISVLKNCPNIEKMFFYDISSGAIEIAKKNAVLNGVENRCEFEACDVMNYVPNEKFDLILSNPPYIPTKDIENLQKEVKNEPFIALDGGDDGLVFIRKFVDFYLDFLNDGGIMILEHGYDQYDAIDKLLKGNQKIKSYSFLYDYSSNPRCVVIQK